MKRSAAILLLLLCSCQPRTARSPAATSSDSVGTDLRAGGKETPAGGNSAHASGTSARSTASHTESVAADAQGVTLTFTTDARGTVHLTGDLCRRLKRDQWLRVEPKNGAAVDQVVTVQWPDTTRTEVLAFNKNNHYLTTANPVADFKAILKAPHEQRGVYLRFKKGGKYLAVARVNTAKGTCAPRHPDVVVAGD